ncbi:SPOSA6832_03804, partial [Sporobolomyces salmonicolor]
MDRLPLFPRIIDDFVKQEAIQRWATPTLLSRILSSVRSLRAYLFSFSPHPSLSKLSAVGDSRWDLTLLGGLLGSLFSFCQCFISPFLGRLSDKYGRRPVQLSIACITDVTTPSTRSRSLALVGIAFSIAFTLGPSLGAYFASTNFGRGTLSPITVPFLNKEVQLNSYAVPAAITVVLLATETAYLAACLPETKGWQKPVESEGEKEKESEGPKRSVAEREKRLRELEWVHLGFLFFFSGAEYTLTFLTHNLFDYSNAVSKWPPPRLYRCPLLPPSRRLRPPRLDHPPKDLLPRPLRHPRLCHLTPPSFLPPASRLVFQSLPHDDALLRRRRARLRLCDGCQLAQRARLPRNRLLRPFDPLVRCFIYDFGFDGAYRERRCSRSVPLERPARTRARTAVRDGRLLGA